jgi:hypothetical protein
MHRTIQLAADLEDGEIFFLEVILMSAIISHQHNGPGWYEREYYFKIIRVGLGLMII